MGLSLLGGIVGGVTGAAGLGLTLPHLLRRLRLDPRVAAGLGDGIFAEVTLRFQAGEFMPWEWTYADYREPDVRAFLEEAREYYRQRLRGTN